MAKNVHLSCPGGPAFRKKAEAEAVADGAPVKRCHRCKWWHVVQKGRRR
jgi:hypothetical protein